jgi:hypothetical protein
VKSRASCVWPRWFLGISLGYLTMLVTGYHVTELVTTGDWVGNCQQVIKVKNQ